MKKFMEKMVVKYSSRICGAAAIVAAMTPLCCRGSRYCVCKRSGNLPELFGYRLQF